MLDRVDVLNGAYELGRRDLWLPRSRIDAEGIYHSPNVCRATEGMFLDDGAQTTAGSDLSGATSTLSGWQGSGEYLAVKLTGARTVGLVAASTDLAYGILQNKPASGQVAEVALEGICKAMAGAAITAGAKVMANSSAQLIPWTSGSGNTMIGTAIEAAGASGVLFTLRLHISPVLT